jgi:hypothetical protein
VEIRHEQRGGDSFSGDIAHANAEAIFVQLNHVEVIAADFTRRLPGCGDLNSGKLRQRAGQQHLLNLARSLEFFLLLLQRDGPFLDSMLQLLIAFSQLSLEFFHCKEDNVGDHRDGDDETTDPREEKRERLAINFGQLQEESRGHGANRPEHELDREKRDPVPRERARHVKATAGDLERNEKVAHREASSHDDEQGSPLVDRGQDGINHQPDEHHRQLEEYGPPKNRTLLGSDGKSAPT